MSICQPSRTAHSRSDPDLPIEPPTSPARGAPVAHPQGPRAPGAAALLAALLLTAAPILRAQCDEVELAGPATADAEHGAAVAACAVAVAVGSPGYDADRGQVTVWRDLGGFWLEIPVAPPPLVTAGARFGETVALNEDGSVLVVGAPENLGGLGTYLVFEWVAATGIYVNTYASSAAGNFGAAVAASGDTIVAGGPMSGAGGHGTVVIRRKVGGSWAFEGGFTSAVPGDLFGSAVALDGDRLLVGASGQTFPGGRVDFYLRTGGVWAHEHTETGSEEFDGFGQAVDVDGDLAIVGAPGWGVGPVLDVGQVRLLHHDGGAWVTDQTFNGYGPGDFLGSSVAVEEHLAMAGSPGAGTLFGSPIAEDAGSCSLFTWDGQAWNFLQPTEFTSQDAAAADAHGSAVALGGPWVVAGAPGADHGAMESGAAYRRDRLAAAQHSVVAGGTMASTGTVPELIAYGGGCGNTLVWWWTPGLEFSSTAYFVFGLTAANAPFKGGVLVPEPQIVIAVTIGGGVGTYLGIWIPWPVGAPPFEVFGQIWVHDPDLPTGFASSPGRRVASPGL